MLANGVPPFANFRCSRDRRSRLLGFSQLLPRRDHRSRLQPHHREAKQPRLSPDPAALIPRQKFTALNPAPPRQQRESQTDTFSDSSRTSSKLVTSRDSSSDPECSRMLPGSPPVRNHGGVLVASDRLRHRGYPHDWPQIAAPLCLTGRRTTSQTARLADEPL
jgi:hypothetical protein